MSDSLIPRWLRDDLITAERLNRMVDAINEMKAVLEKLDPSSASATPISFSPFAPLELPPMAPQDVPTNRLDHFGVPFQLEAHEAPSGSAGLTISPPDAVGISSSIRGGSELATEQDTYTIIATDPWGTPTSVTTSGTPAATVLWDGVNPGTLCLRTGTQARDAVTDEPYGIDTNPVPLPVLTLSASTASSGELPNHQHLVAPMRGNSCRIYGLAGGDGITLALQDAGYIVASTSPADYDPAAEASSASYSPTPGHISGIAVATASDRARNPIFPRIENGKIIISPSAPIAFDNHDFALLRQDDGSYVVTLQQWANNEWNSTMMTPVPPAVKGTPIYPEGDPPLAEAHYADASYDPHS